MLILLKIITESKFLFILNDWNLTLLQEMAKNTIVSIYLNVFVCSMVFTIVLF